MNDSITELALSGTDFYITEYEKDAWRVTSGCVLVFVVPWKNGAPGRRLLLCEAETGRIIPSFVYRDKNYDSWRFLLMAKEDATLVCMKNSVTSILQRNFARHAGLDQYEQEGFFGSVCDFYHREDLKDDVYIGRGVRSGPKVDISTFGMIKGAFDSNREPPSSSDPVYRTAVYALSSMKMTPADITRISRDKNGRIAIEAVMASSNATCRRILLEPGWHKQDIGVIVGNIDGSPVCCVPKGRASYTIFFGERGESRPLTAEIAKTVDPSAFSVGRTLPARKLRLRDVISFCASSMRAGDVMMMLLLSLAGAVIGALLPTLNQKVYDEYIPLGDYGVLLQMCVVIGSFMIGNLLFGTVRKLAETRLSSRAAYDLQNAVYHRVFRLPERFFRQYDSADLAGRISDGTSIVLSFVNTFVISGTATLFSAVYLWRMFRYSARLAWWSLLMIAVYALFEYLINRITMRFDDRIEQEKGRAEAKLYQFLCGIEKLRMAGVEDRAVYEYLVPYTRVQREQIKKNRIEAVNTAFDAVITTVFSMIMYYIITKTKTDVSIGAFIAFNTAFGAFSGAVMQYTEGLISTYRMLPSYKRFRPVLEQAEENEEGGDIPEEITGDITLEHVHFAYSENTPDVITDLSLHIRAGEYVGIVGSSGCGKSTLLKLLLGFETPRTGQICYDRADIRTLDKRALRRKLGVVLQNGRLISGSIYENITITAPWATMSDVQRVVEAVGLADDIEAMPMGLHTMLSETSNTISGGQMQRILIARAIISSPSVLIFDEATSALDNITQAAVCESLDKMNVTRIVVAHRLSTIKNCDRIIVLSEGRIAETGSYSELMERKGLFFRLASRQIADTE